jgi:hypothetical protein
MSEDNTLKEGRGRRLYKIYALTTVGRFVHISRMRSQSNVMCDFPCTKQPGKSKIEQADLINPEPTTWWSRRKRAGPAFIVGSEFPQR